MNPETQGRLAGRIAVITGGNSGIGLAIARTFRDEGAEIAIFGRNPDTLARARAELGDETLAVEGDAARPEDLERLCDAAADRFGGIDVLVVNAGIVEPGRIADVDEEEFDRTCDVNFKGAFFTVRAALPHLRPGGSVILVSSGSNKIGAADSPVYAATKAAVRSLGRSLAADLVGRGVRVNTLSPGFIDTPIFDRSGMHGGDPEGFFAQLEKMIPMGRIGRPEEVADAAVFLASDEASYITGIELPVSGGLGQV
ncbi:MAG: SDR family NAD(P)-dependent oxidoreductase [Gemmatimonadota bacterium]